MPKKYPPCSQSHLWHKHEKPIQKFLNFHYEIMVHFIEFMVSYTESVRIFNLRKVDEKICFKLAKFLNFQTYFYMKTLVDYNYNMKILKSH